MDAFNGVKEEGTKHTPLAHLPCKGKGESYRLTRLGEDLSGGGTSVANRCDREAEWAADVALKRRELGLGEGE